MESSCADCARRQDRIDQAATILSGKGPVSVAEALALAVLTEFPELPAAPAGRE